MTDVEQHAAARPLGQRAPRLEIARDGAWFRLAGGAIVDLSRRRVLRNVLIALAHQRLRAPGVAATSAELFASAWPDERIGRDSARNRLYVAINALRDLGLRAALVRRVDGYLIPPRIVLELR
jgi:hypothetical protein